MNIEATGIRLVHQGEYLSYYEIDYIDTDTNETKTYEMVSKVGSKYNNSEQLTIEALNSEPKAVVLVILNTDHTKMLMPIEFRLGVNNWVANNIAGLIDAGETIEEAAARELREETGLKLNKIIDTLGVTYTCAPVTDDKTVLIICEATGELTGSISPFEDIKCKWYTKEEMREDLKDSRITFAGRAQAFAYMWAIGI